MTDTPGTPRGAEPWGTGTGAFTAPAASGPPGAATRSSGTAGEPVPAWPSAGAVDGVPGWTRPAGAAERGPGAGEERPDGTPGGAPLTPGPLMPAPRTPGPRQPGAPATGARAGRPESVARAPDGGRAPASGPGGVDPVKALLHRHRELCERAVDPLEIAAGLEAAGITDRTAARFRHRDVFALAEELYARVPRTGEARPESTPPLPGPRIRARWALCALLPGAAGAATVAGLRLTQGHPRLLVAAAGLLAVALAVRAALRTGPLAGPPGPRAWTLWLLGYALFGDGLLHNVLTGGPDTLPDGTPDGDWPTALVPALALALAVAPAAWCAHLLAAGARRRLAGSRGLKDFTAAARPLLFGTFTLFLGALAALLALCGPVLGEPAARPQALTLGALFLLARLLTVHRHRRAPALAQAAAAVTEAAALALPLAGRLPHCGFLATPVRTLVDTWGEAAVPALACGAAALTLLLHAGRTLTRASAHAPVGAPE
ncbi:hypothetical protein [Streptomyces misionensis]|uniref:hypothetical protein n=1 Tax=Streptomyces misionensis TaxID=67331 RepID=UPI003410A7D9